MLVPCSKCGGPRTKKGYAYCDPCRREYNRTYRATPRGRIAGLLHDARLRRPVTISREWLLDRLERGVCEATGIPFDFHPRDDGGHQNPRAPSLDRIDPSGDYTPDNTQLVLYAYNTAKGQLHDREARALVRAMGAAL